MSNFTILFSTLRRTRIQKKIFQWREEVQKNIFVWRKITRSVAYFLLFYYVKLIKFEYSQKTPSNPPLDLRMSKISFISVDLEKRMFLK